MTFQQLQYFLEVCKVGSITQAAKQLFVSTSSVSIAISNLEKELGYPVFVRNQKGLQITGKGSQVLEYASRICENHAQLIQIDHDSHRRLQIGSLDYHPCASAFTRLVRDNRHRKDLSLSLTSVLTTPAIAKVSQFDLDIGIITGFEGRALVLRDNLKKKGLQWKLLETVPAVILLGEGHRLYHRETVRPEDLRSDMILDNAVKTITSNNYLKGILRVEKENVLTVESSAARYRLLAEGLGYCVLRMPTEETILQHRLRCIPLEGINYQIYSITNSLRPLDDVGLQFLSYLEEEVQASQKTPPAAL